MNTIFKRKPLDLIFKNKRRKVNTTPFTSPLQSLNTTPINSPLTSQHNTPATTPKNSIYHSKQNKKTRINKPKHHNNHNHNNKNLNNTFTDYKYTKETIPKRIREMVWNTHNGEEYKTKCYVKWCNNQVNVFNYQVGHDVPESKGGTLDLHNLKPICGSCNQSMGNRYTIQEWNLLVDKKLQNQSNNTSGDDEDLNSNSKYFLVPEDEIQKTNNKLSIKQKITIAVFIVATFHILSFI